MAFTVDFIRNSDDTAGYLANANSSGEVTISKLISGTTFETSSTFDIVNGVEYKGSFVDLTDGVYKFTLGASNVIVINDINQKLCSEKLVDKIICGDDVCEIAYFNSIVLLTQTYWGLLETSYQGQYEFNTSELAGEMVTLYSIKTILENITKKCALINEDSTDCGCN